MAVILRWAEIDNASNEILAVVQVFSTDDDDAPPSVNAARSAVQARGRRFRRVLDNESLPDPARDKYQPGTDSFVPKP